MGDAAEKRDDEQAKPAMVEIFFDRLDRLVRALEQLVQNEQRKLAQEEDTARRAAKRAGPTTTEAEERVARTLRRLGR